MLPKIILHNAVSADGRLDNFMPDIGLYYSLVATWKEDATLAGSDTILAAPDAMPDDVGDAAPPNDRSGLPLLVVPDSRGRVRSWEALRRQPFWRDVVVLVSESTPLDYLHRLADAGVASIKTGQDRVDLRAALEELSDSYSVRTLRVDSGGTLNGVLLRAGLVDEVSLLIHPCLVGGTSARSMFRAPDLDSPDDVIPLGLMSLEEVGNGIIWVRYRVVR
jgi:2,5-diamino-6-(ribosylamino)-4(3H)-pyrimidinone 5'-phosphate reductase